MVIVWKRKNEGIETRKSKIEILIYEKKSIFKAL